MKTRILTIILTLFFAFFSGVSLSEIRMESDPKHDQLLSELQGVYQIQMINSRGIPAITTTMLEQIKENQLEDAPYTFMYTPQMRIVVKSKSDQLAGHLFTENEYVIFITE